MRARAPKAKSGVPARWWSLAPFAVFALAFLARLIYLAQVRDLPTFRTLIGDSRSYDQWAGRIAAGGWWRGDTFYQAPLYPYVLAGLRLVTRDHLLAIRVLQAGMGALSCALVFVAGRRFAGPRAGLAAGLLLALNAPGIFFDLLIQKTVLDTLLLAALLAVLGGIVAPGEASARGRTAARERQAPCARSWFGAGLLVGLFSLSRENALVLAAVLPAWLWLRFGARPRAVRARWIGAFALGAALFLGLAGWHNRAAGGDFLVTTGQLGPNLYIGNHPGAAGFYVPLRPGREDPAFERQDAVDIAESAAGRKLSPGEVSGWWARRSVAFMTSQPGAWLGLMGRKLLLVLNAAEIADVDDYYVYQRESSLLRALGWFDHFGVVLVLAAAGMWLGWRDRRRLAVLVVIALAMTLATALFFVFGRYRFPLVPPLAILAGVGIAGARDALRAREFGRLAAAAAVAALAAGVTLVPLVDRDRQSAGSWANLGAAAAAVGDYDAAIRDERRALEIMPDLIQAHYQLGAALEAKGRRAEAADEYRRVLAIDHGNREAGGALVRLLAADGRSDEMLALIDSMPASDHLRSGLCIAAAQGLMSRGAGAEALRLLRAGYDRDPDDIDLANALAWYLATMPDPARRDSGSAVEIARHAAALPGGDSPHVLDTLAAALASAGRYEEAARVAAEAAARAARAGDDALAASIRTRESRYRRGQAYLAEPGS